MYKNLADVYDLLMEDMPYQQWADFLDQIIKSKSPESQTILDLGSGTGSISLLLSRKGYQLTNLDLSEEMTSRAKHKYREAGLKAEFIAGDIRDIDYEQSYDVIISTFDTLNYFTDPQEFQEVLNRIFRALKPGGILVFDMNTKYKFEKFLGDQIYTYNTESLVYIWENNYDHDKRMIDIDLSFFLQKEGLVYERFQEHHVQKYYSVTESRSFLKKAGFNSVEVYQDLEFKKPGKKGIRNFFVCCKSS